MVSYSSPDDYVKELRNNWSDYGFKNLDDAKIWLALASHEVGRKVVLHVDERGVPTTSVFLPPEEGNVKDLLEKYPIENIRESHIYSPIMRRLQRLRKRIVRPIGNFL